MYCTCVHVFCMPHLQLEALMPTAEPLTSHKVEKVEEKPDKRGSRWDRRSPRERSRGEKRRRMSRSPSDSRERYRHHSRSTSRERHGRESRYGRSRSRSRSRSRERAGGPRRGRWEERPSAPVVSQVHMYMYVCMYIILYIQIYTII